ncbi:MAG: hypothetical protein CVV01_04925 [Firmicutes bacterium HGW-Firmicutes-6]|nr:MAG: hypothetical protein CVV01_04925 [Firmicutes bacterium HGW-Firmicutes-6]
MGKHSEETRIINRSKDQCEERLLAFDTSKYDLKNHIADKAESLIVFHTKIVFAANGQRITVTLKNADNQTTEVSVRSELISNVLTNDRGVNKNNIKTIFSYLKDEKLGAQEQQPESVGNYQQPKTKKKWFSWGKNTSDVKLSMMASYLGGYKEFEKSIKGTLEIHEAGIDFAVMGPKFTIEFLNMKSVTIASTLDIEQNQAWQSTCFKDELQKDKTDHQKAKKNKLVVTYQNESGQTQCIFRADNSLEVEKSVLKAQTLIQDLMEK